MKRIILFTDYRDQFYSSVRASTVGFELSKVKKYFLENGVAAEIISFKELDFTQDYTGVYIFYQSSEDRDLLYKNYIQDVIFYLKSRGAILIPDFQYFLCHHNKLYQELMLFNKCFENFIILKSELFGTFEDLVSKGYDGNYPVVVKSASGCTSKGVMLAKNKTELLKCSKKLTSSWHFSDAVRFLFKRYLRKNYIPESLNRNKIVLQQFLSDLDGDYKVLVYGEKYYVLKRYNRKNDFRASGSGLFEFVTEPKENILNAAEELKTKLEVPYISIDFAVSRGGVYLIECQFLMFGTITLEKSNSYFCKNQETKTWENVIESPDLEREFVESTYKLLV